jgi:hypothetical protein
MKLHLPFPYPIRLFRHLFARIFRNSEKLALLLNERTLTLASGLFPGQG